MSCSAVTFKISDKIKQCRHFILGHLMYGVEFSRVSSQLLKGVRAASHLDNWWMLLHWAGCLASYWRGLFRVKVLSCQGGERSILGFIINQILTTVISGTGFCSGKWKMRWDLKADNNWPINSFQSNNLSGQVHIKYAHYTTNLISMFV